jgi:dTDP-4-dehydrorhamnose 3,5-epimerase
MKVVETSIPDVLIIEPRIRGDSRGFFMELFQSDRYTAAGIMGTFVQDNLSRSTAGVLRGLHLQNPRPQGKLVTVLRGSVLDVAVDVRLGSPTYGRHVKIELSEENRRQLWIPRGFAHGFVVLSETADFYYKCDELYRAKAAAACLALYGLTLHQASRNRTASSDRDLYFEVKTREQEPAIGADLSLFSRKPKIIRLSACRAEVTNQSFPRQRRVGNRSTAVRQIGVPN